MHLGQENGFGQKRGAETLNHRLLTAVHENDAQTARRLLSLGADINCRGRRGETPLGHAARMGFTSLALSLLDMKAQPNTQDTEGYSPLMHAAARNDATLVKCLIAAEADITLENKDGEQALNIAFRAGSPDIVELFERPLKLLLQKIPLPRQTHSVEALDPHGDTMLTWAARMGQEHVVRALIEAGTNVHVTNRAGESALDIARARGHHKICNILTNSRASA